MYHVTRYDDAGAVQEVLRISDGARIPACAENPDWQAFVNWNSATGAFVLDPALRTPTLAEIRAERNARLTACDWTQLPDVPLSTEARAAWQAYRQHLRDLPAAYVEGACLLWPTPPEEGC